VQKTQEQINQDRIKQINDEKVNANMQMAAEDQSYQAQRNLILATRTGGGGALKRLEDEHKKRQAEIRLGSAQKQVEIAGGGPAAQKQAELAAGPVGNEVSVAAASKIKEKEDAKQGPKNELLQAGTVFRTSILNFSEAIARFETATESLKDSNASDEEAGGSTNDGENAKVAANDKGESRSFTINFKINGEDSEPIELSGSDENIALFEERLAFLESQMNGEQAPAPAALRSARSAKGVGVIG